MEIYSSMRSATNLLKMVHFLKKHSNISISYLQILYFERISSIRCGKITRHQIDKKSDFKICKEVIKSYVRSLRKNEKWVNFILDDFWYFNYKRLLHLNELLRWDDKKLCQRYYSKSQIQLWSRFIIVFPFDSSWGGVFDF